MSYINSPENMNKLGNEELCLKEIEDDLEEANQLLDETSKTVTMLGEVMKKFNDMDLEKYEPKESIMMQNAKLFCETLRGFCDSLISLDDNTQTVLSLNHTSANNFITDLENYEAKIKKVETAADQLNKELF